MLSKDPRALEIEQLHRALGSRVTIEQAKGVLAERFGLTMHDSFELLRQAARSHRLKVHALAEQIVETRATPSAVADAFDQASRPVAGASNVLLTFVCECSDPGCHEPVTLSGATVSRIHQSGDRLVMKAGHELPFGEQVVERIDGLVIVEQPVG
jgi:ANTAR domain